MRTPNNELEVGQVFVSGGFDDLRSRHIRFLEEAGRLGPVTVLLWDDQLLQKLEGKAPIFPESERRYVRNRFALLRKSCR